MELTLKKIKWMLPLAFALLISCSLIIFILSTKNPFQKSPIKAKVQIFVESKLHIPPTRPISTVPRLAYLISGSSGDGESMKRTLNALYHPLNQYVIHLDLEASADERLKLLNFVKKEPLLVEVGNVRVVVRSNLVTYRGPTMVSNTLHAAAILLKEGGEWDWFINLSASDYPLVAQDDLPHAFSTVPRELNFIEHTSDIGWKEYHRARPVILDSRLYSLNKSDLFWIPQKRSMPTAFKLFTGESFVHFCRCNKRVEFMITRGMFSRRLYKVIDVREKHWVFGGEEIVGLETEQRRILSERNITQMTVLKGPLV